MKGYKFLKTFFSALIGCVIFVSSANLVAQKNIAKGFALTSEIMNHHTYLSTEVISDSLYDPSPFFNSSEIHTDYPENTISVSPSGGMGWGSTSGVLP